MELEQFFNRLVHAVLGWLPESGVFAELQSGPSRAHAPARGLLLISAASRPSSSRFPHTETTVRLRSWLQPPFAGLVLGLHEIMSTV